MPKLSSRAHLLAENLVQELQRLGKNIVTVESCTGGALASEITDVPGASEVFPVGYVTYSNMAKRRLGVPWKVLNEFGVYSPQCAEAMTVAGLNNSAADIAVGITGSLTRIDPANPEGSIPGKVFIAVQRRGESQQVRAVAFYVSPDKETRAEAKRAVVERALEILLEEVNR